MYFLNSIRLLCVEILFKYKKYIGKFQTFLNLFMLLILMNLIPLVLENLKLRKQNFNGIHLILW